jgi:hypothetical protein
MPRLLRQAAIACVAALMLPTLLGAEAFGSFNSPPSASMQVSSATLAAPTSLGLSTLCQLLHLGPQITLTWTATTSAFADGYQILRSTTSGAEVQIASVTGRSTATYTDSNSLANLTTYFYVVRAYKGANWTAPSSEASIGTGLCL